MLADRLGGLASVMVGAGVCLELSSPPEPGQPMVEDVGGVDDQLGEQSADILDRQLDQFRAVGLLLACPGGDDGQDGVGEHHQDGVPVPGHPPADVVLARRMPLLERCIDRQATPGDVEEARRVTGRGDRSGRRPAHRRVGSGVPAASDAHWSGHRLGPAGSTPSHGRSGVWTQKDYRR